MLNGPRTEKRSSSSLVETVQGQKFESKFSLLEPRNFRPRNREKKEFFETKIANILEIFEPKNVLLDVKFNLFFHYSYFGTCTLWTQWPPNLLLPTQLETAQG